MAQLFRISDLAARKRALLAESEVYRESLKLEVENVRLYGARWRRKFGYLKMANQLLLLVPVLRTVWGLRGGAKPAEKKPARSRGTLAWALAGWRVYRNVAPMIRHLVSRRLSRTRANGAEERAPAAAQPGTAATDWFGS